ncbi:MAG: selenocysteine-specific translation elongation factor [Dehalococcoidia bacterium]
MFVIGTAGHVDHGKSVLVEALTGIDPDRLREEKQRGMTIDLGFAWLTLPSGREVSIVDVPGHERFIKNMLAGAGGIDLALLVIAADESVMPQTREHLAIIDLLGVRSGVIVITKTDLADEDVIAIVATDARELVAGTTLEGAPVVPVSAVTRDGLDTLLRVLDEQLAGTETKRDIGRPRLPIDRSFTIAGMGTVVTGTLIDGALEVGQEVAVLPGDLTARIRGLQHHKEAVERALPGRRTAVNLSGVAKEDVRRGQVLALPGTIAPADAIDVRLRALASLRKPLRHAAELTLHAGAAEAPARLLLLDRDELRPGDVAWAQLRLSEPVVVVKGDRVVLRTPNDTVTGGEVVDAHPQRHRRLHEATLQSLEALAGGSSAEALAAALRRIEPGSLASLASETGRAEEELRVALDELALAGDIVRLADGFVTRGWLDALWQRARRELETQRSAHPLLDGMAREELRSKLSLQPGLFGAVLERWSGAGLIETSATSVALAREETALTPAQQQEADAYVAALAAKPYAPPTDISIAPDLLSYLERSGRVVSAAGGVVFTAEAYRDMTERIVEHARRDGSITLAQARDLFGTTRKYAQALLEHLDSTRVTRRVGDARVLRRL